MSFDEEWTSARAAATANVGMRLNQVDGGSSSGGGASDYKVTSPDLKAIGNEAQELYHWFEVDAFHAGAQTDTAATSLDQDGFQTGSALWTLWDTWRTQSETLLSACAHIHNHLEDTVISHANHEEVLVTNFSMSEITKHFS
ncbi:hypothetical protein [Streptomyces sp. FIT100]|uniref:hypothetical protein n=1 Tax=Streptomyces sp. FIT100 TaxID=2837956 RepID=UPI0021C82C4F|nr:hypothetical protein [Streptomyces sp. FIT100]UUN27154.1 hypothetical protein KK483_12640 [Streptomyces sp. FIT100]